MTIMQARYGIIRTKVFSGRRIRHLAGQVEGQCNRRRECAHAKGDRDKGIEPDGVHVELGHKGNEEGNGQDQRRRRR